MLSFALTVLRLIKAVVRSWRVPTFRATLALAVFILLSGTIFYHGVEGWSWIDALYFSATTVSTVGLGDLSPQTEIGKLFTVIYMFVGIGVFVALFTQFARALLHIEADQKASTNGVKPNVGTRD
jgi:voltage-gated potassium channel Kch